MRHAAALALGSSPLVTFGALQLLGSPQPVQWTGVANDLVDGRFWLTLVVMALAGAFGGVAYELLLRKGAVELPHRLTTRTARRRSSHAPPEHVFVLGTLGRALVGAAAAMTVLLVVSPSTAHGAVALGVTAGAGAPAVIRLMKKQLMFAADALQRLSHAPRKQQPAATEPAPANLRTAPQTA
jgi:hypothetical protein